MAKSRLKKVIRKSKKKKKIRFKVAKCRACKKTVKPGRVHHCKKGDDYKVPMRPQVENDNFMLSSIVGYATNNPLLAYAIGGSLVGAITGVAFSNHRRNDDSDSVRQPAYDPPASRSENDDSPHESSYSPSDSSPSGGDMGGGSPPGSE